MNRSAPKGINMLCISTTDKEKELRSGFDKLIQRAWPTGAPKDFHLRLVCRDSRQLSLCDFTSEGKMVLTPFFEELKNDLAKHTGTLLLLDPLDKFWTGDKNSQSQLSEFLDVCLKQLIKETGCTISLNDDAEGEPCRKNMENKSFKTVLFNKAEADGTYTLSRSRAEFGPTGKSSEVSMRLEDGIFVRADRKAS